jgi:predicted alpha/beta hydrolase
MADRDDIVIATSDAKTLCGALFSPEDLQAVVLICAATGIRQQFYWSFAEWLTTQGVAALTFDYRGIGASLGVESVRDNKARKQDWGMYDMPAALDYLTERFPQTPVHLVGHSAGGQLVGLMPNYAHLRSIVTVSSSSGYYRNIALKQRLFATVFLKAYIPLLAKTLGYVPARWIGWGEDLPARVALQWAAWCTNPGYVENSFGSEIKEHYYNELDVPTLWLTATDDPIVTPKNVDDMLRLLKSTPVTRRAIDPAEFDLQKIGHADFFRQRNEVLWPLITDWLLRRPA